MRKVVEDPLTGIALSIVKDRNHQVRTLERALERIDAIAVSRDTAKPTDYKRMFCEISNIATRAIATNGDGTNSGRKKRRLAQLGA